MLNNLVFIAFMISIMFFIIKLMFIRMNKEQDKKIKKQEAFKDSVLIFVLTFGFLHGKDYLFGYLKQGPKKPDVFTNEADF